jgi:hypothetical protein
LRDRLLDGGLQPPSGSRPTELSDPSAASFSHPRPESDGIITTVSTTTSHDHHRNLLLLTECGVVGVVRSALRQLPP